MATPSIIPDTDTALESKAIEDRLTRWIRKHVRSAAIIAHESRGSLSSVEYRDLKEHIADAAEYALLRKEIREVKAESQSYISKIKEPRTYSKKSPFSFFADLAVRSIGPEHPSHADAVARLARHGREVAGEIRSNPNSKEAKRVLRLIGEENRLASNAAEVTARRREEVRTGATSSTAAGFTTPQYLVDQWVSFHTPFRAVASQARPIPMPPVGLQINVPSLTSAATMAQQSEGFGVSGATPTGTNIQAPIITVAGQIILSQQLFERGGVPGLSMDSVIAEQLRESYDTQVDSYVIAQILSGASIGTVSDAGPLTVPLFLGDIASAKEDILNASGNVRPATHMWVNANILGWAQKQVGTNNVPVFSPSWTQQPFAKLAADGDPTAAAWTGHEIGGLAVFQDLSIPNSGSNFQWLVGRPADLMLAESDFSVEAYPEYDPQNLNVVVLAHAYVGAIVRRSAAFTVVSGAAYVNTLA